MEYYNELYHHGVKGMKWGVRRTPEELGQKSRGKKSNLTPKTYYDSLEFRKKTTDDALNKRMMDLLDFQTDDDWNSIIPRAKEICRDVVMSRKPADRHKLLQRMNNVLDDVNDDPGIMAVDKKTGNMRYNSCVKFDLNNIYPDSKTEKYNIRDLDKALGHEPNSTYYYYHGELQNRD